MDNRKSGMRKQARIISAYKNIFESQQGKEVLADLMQVHNMLNSTHSPSVHDIYFKEGERNVVLRILSILKTDTKKLIERIEAHEAMGNESSVI